jgi:hypothetical protein
MLLHLYGLSCKPAVVSFVSSCYVPRDEWNESSSSFCSSVAVPYERFVFLCCHMAVWANIQFCFKLMETAAEVYKILRTVYGNETLSHMHCMSSNGLEDVEWNWEPWKWFKKWAAVNCSESGNSYRVFEQVGRDLQVTLKLREDEVHKNWDMICQVSHK